MEQRRVVVTGVGTINPIGNSILRHLLRASCNRHWHRRCHFGWGNWHCFARNPTFCSWLIAIRNTGCRRSRQRNGRQYGSTHERWRHSQGVCHHCLYDDNRNHLGMLVCGALLQAPPTKTFKAWQKGFVRIKDVQQVC